MGKGRRRCSQPRDDHATISREAMQAMLEELLNSGLFDDEDRPLRFLVGDRVQCRLPTGWVLGTVTDTYLQNAHGRMLPYRVSLDNGTSVIVSVDSDKCVRRPSSVAKLIGAMGMMFQMVIDLLFPTRAQFNARRAGAKSRTSADGRDKESNGAQSAHEDATEDKAQQEPVPTDPFEVLGLPKAGTGVDTDAVNSAYKKMALRWHPDKNGGSAESVGMMQRLNSAKAACLDKLNPAPANDGNESSDNDGDGGGDGGGGGRGSRQSKDESREFGEFWKKRAAEQKKMRREEAKARKKAFQRSKRQSEVQAAREALNRPQTLSKHQLRKAKKLAEEADAEADAEAAAKPTGSGGAPRRALMEESLHSVACALRASAYQMLGELLTFEQSPLAPMDAEGNSALHYAAYSGDVRALNIVVQTCGASWWKAMQLRNATGETPLELAIAVGGVPAPVLERLTELAQGAMQHVQAAKAKREEEEREKRRVFDPIGAIKPCIKPAIFLLLVGWGLEWARRNGHKPS